MWVIPGCPSCNNFRIASWNSEGTTTLRPSSKQPLTVVSSKRLLKNGLTSSGTDLIEAGHPRTVKLYTLDNMGSLTVVYCISAALIGRSLSCCCSSKQTVSVTSSFEPSSVSSGNCESASAFPCLLDAWYFTS